MHIEYDAIAVQYSQHREIHPGVLGSIIEETRLKPEHTVLEVGCGTGNYILAVKSAAGCSCWGIDPSQKMLEIARQRSASITFKQGDAADLPYENGSFNLVFSVDVIHHLQDPRQYFQEAWRTLKPGGLFCTVTENEALLSSRIPLARYFPETVQKELLRYPRIEYLHQVMNEIGFIDRKEIIVRQPYEIKNLKPFENKAFSALHVITESAFHEGLERMRADLEKGPIQAVSHYLLLWGKKPTP